jgi:predicted naringenin-chalcone synthase
MAPQQTNENVVQRPIPRVASSSDFSVGSEADNPSNARDYKVRKSSLIGMINWTHVLLTHAPHMLIVGLVILVGQVVHQVVKDLFGDDEVQWLSAETVGVVALSIKDLFVRLYVAIAESDGFYVFSPQVKTTALILVVAAWLVRRDNPIYVLAFATFKAPDEWKCSHDDLIEQFRRQKCFTDESILFMRRILDRSGTGQATAMPPGICKSLGPDAPKADRSMDASRKEAQVIIFDIVEKALKKANVKPKEIDVLVINCSLFAPTPSLCAMVVSHFGMRSDVATYNLSGMGCSASLISIDLAKKLLGKRLGKALVVSTEIITPNLYHGNDRGFLIQNTLFRCGGAAIVLSNNWMDGRRALYKLLHTVRAQGTGEAAYECVFQTEDSEGNMGVRLSKDIVKVAGKTMEKNLTMLGPHVLPLSEQAGVVWSIIVRFVLKSIGKALKANGAESMAAKLPIVKPYVPDFKRCIDHFCIHAGGRAVIDGIEKNMQLEPFHTEASRMTLYNYGNTSSSSIWYELEYIQEHQVSNPMKKGDRIIQIAFGSGFKCTSGVWLKV